MRSCPACFVNLPLGRRLGMIGPGTWRVHQILCHWKGKCPRISNMSLGSNIPSCFLDFLPGKRELDWLPPKIKHGSQKFEEYMFRCSGSMLRFPEICVLNVDSGFQRVLSTFCDLSQSWNDFQLAQNPRQDGTSFTGKMALHRCAGVHWWGSRSVENRDPTAMSLPRWGCFFMLFPCYTRFKGHDFH